MYILMIVLILYQIGYEIFTNGWVINEKILLFLIMLGIVRIIKIITTKNKL